MELNEFSNSIQLNLTSSNIVSKLKEYHHAIEQLKYKEQLVDEKVHLLEEQLIKIKADERAQRLKCTFLTKQVMKFNTKTK
jgi:hypothetical protein